MDRDETREWMDLCLALDVWGQFHACENPMVYVHHRTPNDVDALCFNCGEQPPTLCEWHTKHIQTPLKLGEDDGHGSEHC